jgi:hypothetical protein
MTAVPAAASQPRLELQYGQSPLRTMSMSLLRVPTSHAVTSGRRGR